VNKTYPQIEELKNQIIDIALVIGTSVGLIVYLLSLDSYIQDGFKITLITDLLVILTLFAITLFRKKLSLNFKAYITTGAIYVLFLFDVIRLGVFSADKVLIILIPFSSLLAISIRKTIGIFIFTVISFVFLAYLHISGILHTPSQEHITVSAWLINILLIVIVALVIAIIQTKFNFTYINLISSLEKTNELISEKEQNYREIFNASTDAIFIHTLEGKILDVNESMLNMYGYKHDDIANISISELSSQNEGFTADIAIEFVRKAIKGKPQLFDWQAKTKDGDYFWVEVSLKKTHIGSNERVLAIVRDITEKKEDALQLELYRNHLKDLVEQKTNELKKTNEELQATNDDLSLQKDELLNTLNLLQRTQEQLIQSEKMASLGVLTAGISHEVNNPLNFIMGGYLGLENYFNETGEFRDAKIRILLNSIQTGIDRVSDIINGLNQFSRNNETLMENCDIHAIINNCLVMLNNQLKNRIEVQKKINNLTISVLGNVGKLHQVFLNVLSNSIQAIEQEGVISISTFKRQNTIVIEISDSGCGINEENIVKITDPFFTTKDPGKGTGLGLSIAYNIIQDHKGTIEFQSKINLGTTVRISLPGN